MKDGWEIKKFENCIGKIPKPQQLKTSEYKLEGRYPIVSQESSIISGYTDYEDYVYHIPKPIVIFGDHTRVLKYVDFDFAVGADGVKILIPTNDINSKFFYYFLRWYNVPSLGYSRHYKLLKDIHIPVPPLPEQEKIVSELDCLSGIIEKKRQQLKELDALAQSIFYEMFGNPVDNERGWEVVQLSSAVDEKCPISYGIVQPMDDIQDGVPIVRPVDLIETFVYNRGLKKTSREISDSYKRTILRGDEILMCVRGTTGIVSLATEELRGCNTTRGIVPLFFTKMNRWFMFHLFKSDAMVNLIAEHTYGIALKQINLKDLRQLPIVIPPLPLQQSFAQKIESIEKQKELIKQSIAEVETLFNSRMDYYFN